MKLRILGDTLRVRLAQAEVARLREVGQVDQSIHFGPSAGQAIEYAVIADPAARVIEAHLSGTSIKVHIPVSDVQVWADGTDVSLRASQDVGAGRELAILIEKDFKCLVPRAGEEDSDGFPNPAS
ncbi:MAG: hypothetical protein AAF721_15795 [Myxococcota bacterium]